jgi:hypothetical protein
MTMAAVGDGGEVKFKDIVQVQVQNKENNQTNIWTPEEFEDKLDMMRDSLT